MKTSLFKKRFFFTALLLLSLVPLTALAQNNENSFRAQLIIQVADMASEIADTACTRALYGTPGREQDLLWNQAIMDARAAIAAYDQYAELSKTEGYKNGGYIYFTKVSLEQRIVQMRKMKADNVTKFTHYDQAGEEAKSCFLKTFAAEKAAVIACEKFKNMMLDEEADLLWDQAISTTQEEAKGWGQLAQVDQVILARSPEKDQAFWTKELATAEQMKTFCERWELLRDNVTQCAYQANKTLVTAFYQAEGATGEEAIFLWNKTIQPAKEEEMAFRRLVELDERGLQNATDQESQEFWAENLEQDKKNHEGALAHVTLMATYVREAANAEQID